MAVADFDLSSLRDALQRVSDEVRREITGLAQQAADALRSTLDAGLPVRTGRLRRATRVLPLETGAMVRNANPVAHIIEGGTVVRRDPTRRNANRGRVPARPVFIPGAIRHWRQFLDAASAVIERSRDLG